MRVRSIRKIRFKCKLFSDTKLDHETRESLRKKLIMIILRIGRDK